MNKFLMSAAAFALLFSTSALAQPDHRHGNERGRSETHQPMQKSPPARPAPAARPTPRPTPAMRPQPAPRPQPDRARPTSERHDSHHDSRQPNTTHRDNNNRPNFNRSDNHRSGVDRRGERHRQAVRPHPRPDYSKWHRARRASKRFHIGTYHAPRGYHYRRWSYGQYLPSIYWGQSYWLTNFMLYGLFAPPPDAVWVRYGPDALLVDRYTGEIVAVEYNVFY